MLPGKRDADVATTTPAAALFCVPPAASRPRPVSKQIKWTAHPNTGPIEHMRIDHRRCDIRMPEQFLHGSDVCAIRQHTRCKAVKIWSAAATNGRHRFQTQRSHGAAQKRSRASVKHSLRSLFALQIIIRSAKWAYALQSGFHSPTPYSKMAINLCVPSNCASRVPVSAISTNTRRPPNLRNSLFPVQYSTFPCSNPAFLPITSR